MLSVKEQRAVKTNYIMNILTPIVLAGIGCFVLNENPGIGVWHDADHQFLFNVRFVMISIGLVYPLLGVVLNKTVYNEDKLLSKFSDRARIKEVAKKAVKNAKTRPESKQNLQKWLENPQDQNLFQTIREDLFLNAIISSKMLMNTLSIGPSLMGFILYAGEANLTVFTLSICLSYVMFYLTYFSEEKLYGLIRRLEIETVIVD